MNKVVRLLMEMRANPGSAPLPLSPALMRRIRIGATTGMVLLMLVLVFMVAAAWAPGRDPTGLFLEGLSPRDSIYAECLSATSAGSW
jgi:hypothetical protein